MTASAVRATVALLLALGAGNLAAAEDLDCLIEPNEVVTLATPVEGVIESVTVERGDMVKKGQVVATLESSVERAALMLAKARAESNARIENAKARLLQSTREHERLQALARDALVSTNSVIESMASFASRAASAGTGTTRTTASSPAANACSRSFMGGSGTTKSCLAR